MLQGQKTNCNYQLCKNPRYQVAVATKFSTMAPNLWRSSIRHYLGFHCGASEIYVLLGSYTAQIGNSIPIFRDNLAVPSYGGEDKHIQGCGTKT
jgi:opacity protein-like surface antigen